MSFLTLGIFWVGQQTQLNQIERSNRSFAWMNLGFLLDLRDGARSHQGQYAGGFLRAIKRPVIGYQAGAADCRNCSAQIAPSGVSSCLKYTNTSFERCDWTRAANGAIS